MSTTLVLIGLVAALAGYRLAQALSVDEVGSPVRQSVLRFAWPPGAPSGYAPSRLRRLLLNLVSCPMCAGFWITLAIGLVLSPQLTDATVTAHLAIAFAATGLQYLLAVYTNHG